MGCAGREANPISSYKAGDENLSCEKLKKEIVVLQTNMMAILPKSDKTFTNALWYTGGSIVIIPVFFIDMKDAERIEYEAFRRRHNRLVEMAQTKGCDMDTVNATTTPTLEQQKVMKQESKKNQ